MLMIEYSWLIPLLPLLAFLIIVSFCMQSRVASFSVAVAGMAGATVLALSVCWRTISDVTISMTNPVEYSLHWMQIGSMQLEMGLLIDPLTGVMLVVVTLIALLVMIYSAGYMSEDPGFSRYYAWLCLFTFSMLGLVVANNFFQMFVFWELVGLCSYLLIGFWFHKNSAVEANKKAFITNRVADFAFLVGIIMLFWHFGTFNFIELGLAVAQFANIAALTVIAILIFIGPVGKSGQFPLHVWLPDAMEGPTPVSALIHAATMVAAGVYLLARAFFLFAAAPSSLVVIAWTGGITAFVAATIALTQTDLKRILAYSTLSQLGFMVLAVGAGSISAAMFHLTTHAFFKALLFLGAGSVLHAVGSKSIFEMGNLYRKMPITTWTFVIGALALAGLFPLAGFWSKDSVLMAVDSAGMTSLWYLATFTAFLTAFYMFRLIFLVFFGKGNPDNHPHESPLTMTVPLVILAVLSVAIGFVGAPYLQNNFFTWIYFGEVVQLKIYAGVILKSIVTAALGIGLAWMIYYQQLLSADKLRLQFKPIYTVLHNKYYIDELYQWFFDKVVLGIGKSFNWSDRKLVDGIADGSADATRGTGIILRKLHSGYIQQYLNMFIVGFIGVLIISIILTTGGIR